MIVQAIKQKQKGNMKNYKRLQILLQEFTDLVSVCEDDTAKKGASSVLFSELYNLVIQENMEFLKNLKPFLSDDAYRVNHRILTAMFRSKRGDI